MDHFQNAKEEIRTTIGNVLGNAASKAFYTRVDRIINECADIPSLEGACSKLISIADLFIGEEKAREIQRKCSRIFENIAA